MTSPLQYHDMPDIEAGAESLAKFLAYVQTFPSPNVLELGTKQSQPGRSTMHKSWVPHAHLFNGTDIEIGADVDFVADVHKLSKVAGESTYDVVVSCSSFEHFKYPHLAAFEISKTLKLGGAVFVQTHFTFPLHSYPFDYFRFTKEALAGCFGSKNGIEVVATDYTFPCDITSSVDGRHGSYLNVNLFGIKVAETPDEFVFELDTDL